jgi:histidyl-tRNA synthetase
VLFEIVAPKLGVASPIAGGGRYDGLLADVGAPVRCRLWVRAFTLSDCWLCSAIQRLSNLL